jgi:cyclopropane-fatty-acyl-phospholipid synthase
MTTMETHGHGFAQKLRSAFDDKHAAELVREILQGAGITVGGDAPWDVHIKDERFYTRAFRDGTLGVGEAYVDGWWECEALDQMMERVLRARLDKVVRESWVLVAQAVRARLFNLQVTRAFEVGQRHYDIGNDLYQEMLDPRMVYTCAYWKDATDLDAAQEAKLDLVCRKVGLRSGMRVLDLGCGWGGFAGFAAERYGVSVVGMTVSKEQVAWAKEKYAHLPVDVRLDDYRNATGTYDAVVSIGLMEHVGPKNYRGYMELVDRCLVPDGVAFVHTIAGLQPRATMEPWFDKYIFPNAVLPTLGQLANAMDALMVPEDVHNIGEHYVPTLMAWWQRFDAAWPQLRARYGEPFYRMWKYYLLSSAAAFRARKHQLYQIVMTRKGTAQPGHARAL